MTTKNQIKKVEKMLNKAKHAQTEQANMVTLPNGRKIPNFEISKQQLERIIGT